jgi:hypothetical protein
MSRYRRRSSRRTRVRGRRNHRHGKKIPKYGVSRGGIRL